MRLDSAHFVVLALRVQISLVRLFRSAVYPNIGRHAVDSYAGTVPFARMGGNTKKSGFIAWAGSAPVLRVVAGRTFSKVADSVVGADAINVVKRAFRPLPIVVVPSEPVRLVKCSGNLDLDISPRAWASRNAADLNRSSGALYPDKHAGFGVVVQMGLEIFVAKVSIRSSHFVAPCKQWIGERLTSIHSVCRPRYIIRGNI